MLNSTFCLLMFQIEEHRICVCVRARPLNKKGERLFIQFLNSTEQSKFSPFQSFPHIWPACVVNSCCFLWHIWSHVQNMEINILSVSLQSCQWRIWMWSLFPVRTWWWSTSPSRKSTWRATWRTKPSDLTTPLTRTPPMKWFTGDVFFYGGSVFYYPTEGKLGL